MSVRVSTVSKPPHVAKPFTLAGASVRWAVQSAVAAGRVVDAADEFGDRETLAAARHWTPLSEHTPDNQTVWVGGSSRRVDSARLPLCRLQNIAAACGFDVPETRRQTPPPGDWLTKSGGSGGLGVRRSGSRQDFRRSEDAESLGDFRDGSTYWQRRIAGRPAGAVWLADAADVRLLAVCRSHHRRIGDRPYVYAGSSGPLPIDPAVSSRLQTLGHRITDATGWRGLFNVDFVVNGVRWWVLEANDRPTASCEVIERSWRSAGALAPRQSLIDWHCRAITGERCLYDIPPVASPPRWHKRILYAVTDQHFDADRVVAPAGVELTDLPVDPVEVAAGWPLCTAIWRSSSPAAIVRT